MIKSDICEKSNRANATGGKEKRNRLEGMLTVWERGRGVKKYQPEQVIGNQGYI